MKKLAGIVLFIAVCGSLIAGCEDQTGTKQDTRKQDNKTIIVGPEGNIPGWVQTDTKNAVSGYDCEIWSEIGKRTGYEIRQEVLESDELKEQLSDGTIDSIEGKLTADSDYAKGAYCSEVYAYEDSEEYVFVFDETDEGKKLCDSVSKVIRDMKEDGTLQRISEKWFDKDITVQP